MVEDERKPNIYHKIGNHLLVVIDLVAGTRLANRS